jgi:hypothetical protein
VHGGIAVNSGTRAITVNTEQPSPVNTEVNPEEGGSPRCSWHSMAQPR